MENNFTAKSIPLPNTPSKRFAAKQILEPEPTKKPSHGGGNGTLFPTEKPSTPPSRLSAPSRNQTKISLE